MSIDKSLKIKDALQRHRNVLTRAERIEMMKEEGRWTDDDQSVFGLPKIAHRKAAAGGKEKKAAATEEAKTEGDAPVAEEPKT